MGSQLGLKSAQHSPVIYEDFDTDSVDLTNAIQYMASAPPNSNEFLKSFQRRKPRAESSQSNLQNYIAKMKDFEQTHEEDIFLNTEQYRLLLSTFKRLDRVQNLVGHGNFNVISFDEMVRFSRRYSSVGQFKGSELAFLEEIFFDDADHRRQGWDIIHHRHGTELRVKG